MDLGRLQSKWHQKYPECQPKAEILKHVYKDKWVRFHSLPKSKRYPETDDEYKIMLERHNAILSELNPGDLVVVVTSEWNDSSKARPDEKSKRSELQYDAEYWQTFEDEPDDPENPNYRHLYVSEKKWRPGELDELLRSVADDAIGGVIIAPVDFRWLYHPYDGGADVILPTSAERDSLKRLHQDWLPSNVEEL